MEKISGRIKNITWKRFWRRTVLNIVENNSRHSSQWLCLCDCWTKKVVLWWRLNAWKSTSCWCYHKDIMTKHWLCKNIIYDTYIKIRRRCYNEKDRWFKSYWWRWIKCEREDVKHFIDDMLPSFLEHYEIHWKRNTTIERIDVNWNYSKDIDHIQWQK